MTDRPIGARAAAALDALLPPADPGPVPTHEPAEVVIPVAVRLSTLARRARHASRLAGLNPSGELADLCGVVAELSDLVREVSDAAADPALIRLTRELVARDPAYWIAGPGHPTAYATSCPHGYRLTDSCPGCDVDAEAGR